MNAEAFQMAITLFGGLAIFIYGMNLLRDRGSTSCSGRDL